MPGKGISWAVSCSNDMGSGDSDIVLSTGKNAGSAAGA